MHPVLVVAFPFIECHTSPTPTSPPTSFKAIIKELSEMSDELKAKLERTQKVIDRYTLLKSGMRNTEPPSTRCERITAYIDRNQGYIDEMRTKYK